MWEKRVVGGRQEMGDSTHEERDHGEEITWDGRYKPLMVFMAIAVAFLTLSIK